MVSNCANPSCSARFRYLHEGKLFHVPVVTTAPDNSTSSGAPTLERFWLCEECSSRMTVVPDPTGAFNVVLQEQPTSPGTTFVTKRWPSV